MKQAFYSNIMITINKSFNWKSVSLNDNNIIDGTFVLSLSIFVFRAE